MRQAALGLMALAGCGAARPANVANRTIAPGAETPAAGGTPAGPIAAASLAPGASPPLAALAPTHAPSCPADMVALATFCVDRFEAPNVRGALPLALQTAYDGEAWCAARGKRLCSEDEWIRACEGPRGRRFPYGDVHRASVCNDDRPWRKVSWPALAKWPDAGALAEATRLFQGDASGVRAGCVSEEGVFDLTGNVAEWVRRSDAPPRAGYDHVLKGCYWAGCYHEPQPNCEFRNSAHPGTFRTYEAGFRCCREQTA